jgi:hypothetical protein
MNNRQLIAVLVALGLVAVGVVWKYRSNNPSGGGRSSDQLSKVLTGDLNDVVAIQIKNAKEEVNLARVGDTWGVKERDGYPANYEYVRDLVTKAFDLKAVDTEVIGKSQLGRVHLISPVSEEAKSAKPEEIGTLVVFKKENDQEIDRLLLGRTIEAAEPGGDNAFFNMAGSNGRYVQSGAKTGEVHKVREAFTSLSVDVKQWVEKQFISPSGGLKSIEVKVSDPADQSWRVEKEKEGADPVLADKKEGEEIDPEKVKQAGSAFSSAYFSDVATAADKEKSGLDAPKRTATVTFFDGFTYTIKVGNRVKPEDENSDYYLALNVAFTPLPEPAAPTATAPPEPAPTPVPEGETEEQKKEREKKDADARASWELAKKSVDDAKAKYDADKKMWEDTKKRNEERLAKEKGFEDRIYIVSKYTVDWFLKDRVYFRKAAAAPAAAAATTPAAPAAPTTTTVPPVPGSAVFSTPVTVPATSPAEPEAEKPKRIEAVTPPIPVEVPARDDPKKTDIIKEAPNKPPKVEAPATPDAPKTEGAGN